MGSTLPPPALISAHLQIVQPDRPQALSFRLSGESCLPAASGQSLAISPHGMMVRRNERSQVSNRVRRARKVSPALGPLLRRTFSAAPKPPDRTTASIAKDDRGRSPPAS